MAFTYDDQRSNYVRNGATVYIVYPKEGAVSHDSYVGIIKNAKHMENAKKFADFIVSPKAQNAFGTQLTNVPLMKGVELGPHATDLSQINLVYEDSQEIEEKKGMILERWTDILTKYRK